MATLVGVGPKAVTITSVAQIVLVTVEGESTAVRASGTVFAGLPHLLPSRLIPTLPDSWMEKDKKVYMSLKFLK